jgi:replicative DNA helicase
MASLNNSDLLGRVSPQALELEEVVLGAILLDVDAISAVVDILKPSSFYKSENQVIYSEMLVLFQKGTPIDMLTLTESLKKNNKLEKAGGYYAIAELTTRITSSANLEYHARIVSEKHILRELIRVGVEITKSAYDPTTDALALIDKSESMLFSITENHMTKGFQSTAALSGPLLKQLEALSKNKGGITGVPTGFDALDKLTSGLQKSDLIIMAARPGMGKTSLILAIARNTAVDFKKTVAIFSLEMSNLQLVQRLVSLEAEIEGSKFRNGNLEPHEWAPLSKAIERISAAPIFIDDTPAINTFELRAKCRRLKQQYDVQLIIIDYLQLMSNSGERSNASNREQEISQISRTLKGLAKELNVPIIALSQLSRAVESRGGVKRPQLSDLRESGAIEQDADMVTFIYRPEYYGLTEDENGNSNIGVAELIIAKNRHGAMDTIKLKFIAQYAKFANLNHLTHTIGTRYVADNDPF